MDANSQFPAKHKRHVKAMVACGISTTLMAICICFGLLTIWEISKAVMVEFPIYAFVDNIMDLLFGAEA